MPTDHLPKLESCPFCGDSPISRPNPDIDLWEIYCSNVECKVEARCCLDEKEATIRGGE